MSNKKHNSKETHEYKEGHNDGLILGERKILQLIEEIISTGKSDTSGIGTNNNSKFVEIKKKLIEIMKSIK